MQYRAGVDAEREPIMTAPARPRAVRGGAHGLGHFEPGGGLDHGARQGNIPLFEEVRAAVGADFDLINDPVCSVRRDKAPFLSGCESRPATVAPAGSSRSGRWR